MNKKKQIQLVLVATLAMVVMVDAAARRLDSSNVYRFDIASDEHKIGDGDGFASHYEPSFFGRIRVDTKTAEFKDQYNRVIMFHGCNLVEKGFPWYPQELLNETYLDNLKKWGFNALRLGTMWTGFMPLNGDSFNETHIAIMHTIVDNLNKRGIYPFFDMHQDVLSFLYEGVPQWLLSKFPPAKHAYPWPLPKAPSGAAWAEGYLAQATSFAFQQLYKNTSGSVTHWSRFWQRVATEFGKNPFILGYELINEPWAGDIYTEPSVIIPGIAGSRNLAPLYDELVKAIRQVDNESLIFYEPVTWGIFSPTLDAGTGFSTVPGGPGNEDRSVLSYHYYCWILTQADQDKPYPHFKKIVCDDVLLKQAFPTVLKSVKRTGGGLFLTEFGNCRPTADKNATDTIECSLVLQTADEFKQSWTYWDSTFYDDKGNVYNASILHFARVYPRATAGILHSFQFDPYTHLFAMSYSHDTSISQPTIIVVPEIHYPNGAFKVVIQPATSFNWTYDAANSVIYITPINGPNTASTESNGAFIDVTVNIAPN